MAQPVAASGMPARSQARLTMAPTSDAVMALTGAFTHKDTARDSTLGRPADK